MTNQQDLNAKNQYQLIIVANEGGSVTQTGGVFEAGASVNVIAVPDEGYNFISWSGDLDAFDSNITITVYSDLYVAANFEAIAGN